MKHLLYLLFCLFQACLGVSSSTGCGVGCTTCNNSTSCLVCQSGYYTTPNGACAVCAPNCNSCVAVNTCSIGSCYDGYFYNSTSLTCQRVSKTIRLIDGATHHEGRIEILYSGAWGTVTGDYFDTNDAIVACRQLGSNGGTPLPTQSTVDGAGPIWLDNLQCKGNEMSLVECSHSKPTANDYHWNDIGVNCGCTSNCLHCIVDNTCLPTECSPGYVFNSTSLTCEACSQYCHYCARPNTCEQNSCYSSYYYNTSLQACHRCPWGCSYCTSPYTCEPNGCSSGFVYNTTTRKCSQCANYCSYCSSENTCYPNRCYSGYTYDITTKKCLKCANYCYHCASAGTCVLNGCQYNYSFVLGNTSKPCIACDAGIDCTSTLCPTRGYTYDVQLQQCVACPPNCLYCPSGSECVSNGCNSGYIFNATTKTCQRVICSTGCNYCSSNGTCLSNGCSSSYTYNASSQACESCVNKCYSCKTPGTCTNNGCNSRYVYDVENNTCKACIDKCSSCKVPNTCSVGGCLSRYAYDIENNTCRACTANCAQCVIPNTCALRGCDRDYYYDTEKQLCKLSPCKTNSMQCNNRGSCTSLTDYPHYQCTCSAGYTGLRCADACSPSCANCEAANTCLPNGCMPGYDYNSTTQTCTGYGSTSMTTISASQTVSTSSNFTTLITTSALSPTTFASTPDTSASALTTFASTPATSASAPVTSASAPATSASIPVSTNSPIPTSTLLVSISSTEQTCNGSTLVTISGASQSVSTSSSLTTLRAVSASTPSTTSSTLSSANSPILTISLAVATSSAAETTKINDKYIGITIGSVAAVLVGIAVLIGLVVIKKRKLDLKHEASHRKLSSDLDDSTVNDAKLTDEPTNQFETDNQYCAVELHLHNQDCKAEIGNYEKLNHYCKTENQYTSIDLLVPNQNHRKAEIVSFEKLYDNSTHQHETGKNQYLNLGAGLFLRNQSSKSEIECNENLDHAKSTHQYGSDTQYISLDVYLRNQNGKSEMKNYEKLILNSNRLYETENQYINLGVEIYLHNKNSKPGIDNYEKLNVTSACPSDAENHYTGLKFHSLKQN